MAILGLVFAFVFSPLGIVFSAMGLSQTKKRNEGGRGLAIAGLVLSIVFTLLGIALLIALVFVASEVATEAAEDSQAAGIVETEPAEPAEPAADPDGVVAACDAMMPAMNTFNADMATVTTPDEYAAVTDELLIAMEDAAVVTTDEAFLADVELLYGDLVEAAEAVLAGEDPSYLESDLTTHGAAVDNACAAAGWTE
jgi:hypothetical protein